MTAPFPARTRSASIPPARHPAVTNVALFPGDVTFGVTESASQDRARRDRSILQRVVRVYPGSMSKGSREHERSDRNRERSREAHWQAAEAGAEESDRPQTSPELHEPTDDREDEGGALDSDSPNAAEKHATSPQQD